MIHTNIWKPDTCDCTIVYQWDDSVSVEQRMHTPIPEFTNERGEVFTTTSCDEHSLVTDHNSLHQIVQTENVTKNQVRATLQETYPDLTQQVWNSKAGPIPVIALNPDFIAKLPAEELSTEFIKEPVISFTKTDPATARSIAIDHPDLTTEQVATALTQISPKVATLIEGQVE